MTLMNWVGGCAWTLDVSTSGLLVFLTITQTRPMGLPYMPISWGGAKGVNVGIYGSPMGRVWVK